jgi:uncharacterized protein with von Willebrand factor type A (vWA) domain
MWNNFQPLVYKVASISQLLWTEYLSYFEDAQMLLKDGESKLFGFPSFTLEVFHRLYYESSPEKLDPMPPEGVWIQKLHDEFSQVIDSDRLVEQCQSNQLAAGLATVEYCRTVIARLPAPRRQLVNPQQFRNKIRQLKQVPAAKPTEVFKDILNTPVTPTGLPLPKTKQQHSAQQWIEKLIEQSGDETQTLIQLLQQEGKQAVFEAQQYAASLEGTQIRQVLRLAIAAATEKLEESIEWLEMIGLSCGNETSQDTQVSPAEKQALVQKIASNTKLKQIAKLAGRFKQLADRKRRSKAKNAFGEIATIELGNNLSRLLPSELQKLSEEALFPLFAKGYYDRSLLQYKTSGKEKQSQGPLVVCLDSSGSMEGLADTWAKAVTAVLGQIAIQDSRHFRVLHFAKSVRRIDDFPPQHHDFSKLLESIVSFYAGGGTDWQPALQAAIDCIEKQQHFKQADIVLVTDGQCDVNQEFVKQLKRQKEQLEFTVYGILIGDSGEQRLKKLCDRVWAVENLVLEEAVIEELFLL